MTPFYPVCAPDQPQGKATAYDANGRKLGTMTLPRGSVEDFVRGTPKWMHFHPADYMLLFGPQIVDLDLDMDDDSIVSTVLH